jgi:hypothetical protein
MAHSGVLYSRVVFLISSARRKCHHFNCLMLYLKLHIIEVGSGNAYSYPYINIRW